MQKSSGAEHAFQHNLTEMETECLYLVAEGRQGDEIGAVLSLDRKHTEDLLTSAAAKLGARNRLHAVSIALSRGILQDRNGN
ncbi:LuxR C-terminal-related transcriptional regulator [Pseudomonas sp. R2.Fl]|nr:LuxR C-terminal-related transcriptional regulator [Pseudomonas sp. R2.Fl]